MTERTYTEYELHAAEDAAVVNMLARFCNSGVPVEEFGAWYEQRVKEIEDRREWHPVIRLSDGSTARWEVKGSDTDDDYPDECLCGRELPCPVHG